MDAIPCHCGKVNQVPMGIQASFRPIPEIGPLSPSLALSSFPPIPMDAPKDPTGLTDQLFHRMGRNLINYQTIEVLLRTLVAHGDIHGSLEKMEVDVNGGISASKSYSMGKLVELLFANVVCDELSEKKASDEIENGRFRVSFKLMMPNSQLTDLKKELKSIVNERNFLAHGIRFEWQHRSSDSTQELVARLDRSREAAIAMHGQLLAMAKSMTEAINEHLQKCSSDEGLAQLEQDWLRKTRISRLLSEMAKQAPGPDGWLHMATAGNKVRDELPEYLERPGPYCGHGSLKRLMEATGLFEFREPSAESGTDAYFRLKSPI